MATQFHRRRLNSPSSAVTLALASARAALLVRVWVGVWVGGCVNKRRSIASKKSTPRQPPPPPPPPTPPQPANDATQSTLKASLTDTKQNFAVQASHVAQAMRLSTSVKLGKLFADASVGVGNNASSMVVLDDTYGPLQGDVVCYTDDVGDVVGLEFNSGALCSSTANKVVIGVTPTDKITSLAIAVSPKTGKVRERERERETVGFRVFVFSGTTILPPSLTTQVGQVVFVVENESGAVVKQKCGSGGGVPVETLPKGMVVAGLDAACKPRPPTRRLLQLAGDVDATSIRVIATRPGSTAAGLYVPGVVTPTAPRSLTVNWTAAASTIEAAFLPPDVLGVPGPTLYLLRCVPVPSGRDAAKMWAAASSCPPVGPGILMSEPASQSPLRITGGMVLGVFYACHVEARNSMPPRARDRPVAACSDPVDVETAVAAGAPRSLVVTRPLVSGDAAATFAFTAPSYLGAPPVTSYTVFCRPSASGGDCRNSSSVAGAVQGTSVANATTVTVGGLVAGTTYSCAAVAQNDAGLSECSAPVPVTPYLLDPPTGLAVPSPLVSGATSATFAYSAAANLGAPPLTGYKIYCQTTADPARCQDPTAPGVVAGTSNGTALVLTGLSPGTLYTCWAVATFNPAFNALGESACSSPVSATPYGLNPPTALSLTSPIVSGAMNATFSFAAPVNRGSPPLTGYKIYCQASADPARCQDANGPGVVTGVSNGLAMTITGLSIGTAYTCWAVSTLNPAPANTTGESACSSPVSVTLFVLDPPTTLALSSPLVSGATNVTFTFAAPANLGSPQLTGYKVYCHTLASTDPARCQDVNAPGVVTGTSIGSAPLTITGLWLHTTYTCWAVATITPAPGESACSSTSVSVTPYSTAPGNPWMGRMASLLGPRTVSAVVLPGTHDSGTSGINDVTGPYTAKTQTRTIGEQLVDGIRYFDFRVRQNDNSQCPGPNAFVFYHGQVFGESGGYHDSYALLDALASIRTFFQDPANAKEIVILDFQKVLLSDGTSDGTKAVLLKTVYDNIGAHMLPVETALGRHAKTLHELWDANQQNGESRNVVVLVDQGSIVDPQGCVAQNAYNRTWFGARTGVYNGRGTYVMSYYDERSDASGLKDNVDGQLRLDLAQAQGRPSLFAEYRAMQQSNNLTVLQLVARPIDYWYGAAITGYDALLNYGALINLSFNNCPAGASGWLGQRLWAGRTLGGTARWNPPNIIIVDNYLAGGVSVIPPPQNPLPPPQPVNWRAMVWNSGAGEWVQSNTNSTGYIDFVTSLNLVPNGTDPGLTFSWNENCFTGAGGCASGARQAEVNPLVPGLNGVGCP